MRVDLLDKPVLPFVLIIMSLGFGLLALYFANLSTKRDVSFVVNLRRFIVFFLIAQSCAILAGIELGRWING